MNTFRGSANETSILGEKGRLPGASNRFVHFLLGGCKHTLIKFKILALFFFGFFSITQHKWNSKLNQSSIDVLLFSSMFLPAWVDISIIWNHFKYQHCFDQHKSTKIKMQIIFNQTAHFSLNHLENTAAGSFQCTPAPLYLSLRAEFCPALCAIAHTYGF